MSRQLPGRNDFITVRSASGKERVQTKMLVMTVMEAYSLFKAEHKDTKIGKSKFASLRPKHVLPITERDQTVCCCRYHENVELLIIGLKKLCPAAPQLDDMIKQLACRWEMKCYFGECEECRDVSAGIDRIFAGDIDDDIICSYYQWSAESKKVPMESSFHEAKQELAEQAVALKRHSFIAKVQLQQI